MGCFYVEIEGLLSRELFLISLTIFNVKAQVPRVQQREQIILEQTFFSRVPHSGGTSVSSAGFFFEWFGEITLEHRVCIVIGLRTEKIGHRLLYVRTRSLLSPYNYFTGDHSNEDLRST